MEFRSLSFIPLKGFWNVEHRKSEIFQKTLSRMYYQMCYSTPYHTFSMKQVHICIIFNALPHVTFKFFRKQFPEEL